jgi:Ni,Fe-hydrogenase I cytochrome b subunit
MNATLPISERAADQLSSSAKPVSPAPGIRQRHFALVRVTHWLTTLAFLALLLSGCEILLSHPRLYWAKPVM